ncbi:PRA1 family protein B1 [Magnolia sinica]|uniref:PRA1 family protein B1 n=1 Tax=Magnolia sinica TaxID=86752 RepID=UPI00265ABFF5|nr:PRA1 family protein B1 [Magnolia sinica]
MAHPPANPPLPISTPQTLPTSQTTPSTAPPSTITTTPAFRAFLSHLSSTVRQSLSLRRPWSELLDRSAFSRPSSLSEATSRLRKNASYFRVNYAIGLASVLALSLLSHPISLLTLLVLLAAWLFLYLFRPSDPPLVLFGRTFSDRETLAGLVGLTIIVVFLTSVGSLLISALLAGVAIVSAHGAFRVPEDLFLDDQEPAATGLLSFLGASVPPVATRV